MTGPALILFGVVCFVVSHEVPLMPMWVAISSVSLSLLVVILSYFADELGSKP